MPRFRCRNRDGRAAIPLVTHLRPPHSPLSHTTVSAAVRHLQLLLAPFIFAFAFLYVLPEATELIDDHFMHVAWGRQLLFGRQPLRDMEALGLPMQALLSAGSELVFGYRLLSEGLLVSSAFALGAVVTFVIARSASGSSWIGASAAVLLVALGPRTYSYPKIVVYAAGILLLWRYVDRPSARRAALLGAAVACAFYLRHDHGASLGMLTIAVVALRHSSEWIRGVQRSAVVIVTGLLVVAPFLVYVHRNGGVVSYVQELRGLAAREFQQNRFDSLPEWPFKSFADVFEWRVGPPSSTIGVRWHAGASEAARRTAAARYQLRVDDDELLESGRFLLTDISRDNVVRLLGDPTIEDTAGIDRSTGDVPRQGMWIGRLHLLGGLDAPYASAGFLFYGFVALLTSTAIALVSRRYAYLQGDTLKVRALVLAGVATMIGFVREPLAIRVPDAAVAPVILAAWWTGRWWSAVRLDGPMRNRVLVSCVAILLAAPAVRAVVVVGAVPTRLERMGQLSAAWQQLITTPPVDAWESGGGPKHRAVSYVRACTQRHEPLLVLWFAPDLYYYSDRPFAGRLGFYLEGYWASEELELKNIAAIERDRPALALMESDREVTDLYTHPQLLRYLAESYHHVGTISGNEGRSIEVLARNGRVPSSRYGESEWPCFSAAHDQPSTPAAPPSSSE